MRYAGNFLNNIYIYIRVPNSLAYKKLANFTVRLHANFDSDTDDIIQADLRRRITNAFFFLYL